MRLLPVIGYDANSGHDIYCDSAFLCAYPGSIEFVAFKLIIPSRIILADVILATERNLLLPLLCC